MVLTSQPKGLAEHLNMPSRPLMPPAAKWFDEAQSSQVDIVAVSNNTNPAGAGP